MEEMEEEMLKYLRDYWWTSGRDHELISDFVMAFFEWRKSGMAEVIRTLVHLTDVNGWEKTIEHAGDYRCDGVYMERRVPDLWVPDLSKPFGELIPDDRKFYLCGERIEKEGRDYVKKADYLER